MCKKHLAFNCITDSSPSILSYMRVSFVNSATSVILESVTLYCYLRPMNAKEKSSLRYLFEKQILQLDGKAFQDFFWRIMRYRDPDFVPIRPHGNIGDRKNDGYNPRKGVYYQVYAPEEPGSNPLRELQKLNKDFEGLRSQWNPINEYHFVMNDKWRGIHADLQSTIADLAEKHGLKAGSIIHSATLERWVFDELDDDKLYAVMEVVNFQNMARLPFHEVRMVVDHIMAVSVVEKETLLALPNWDEKIRFNGLSPRQASHLAAATDLLHDLEVFLAEDFALAESLKSRLQNLYEQAKSAVPGADSDPQLGSEVFVELIDLCLPGKELACYQALMVIFAKYFEVCDIFENPS